MIARRLWPSHVCCYHPKKLLPQKKGKRCRPAHHLCANEMAMGSIADPPVVARARLATDPQGRLVWSEVDAFQTARCPGFHDIDQGATGCCCHLRSEQAFAACRWTGQEHFVGRP